MDVLKGNRTRQYEAVGGPLNWTENKVTVFFTLQNQSIHTNKLQFVQTVCFDIFEMTYSK